MILDEKSMEPVPERPGRTSCSEGADGVPVSSNDVSPAALRPARAGTFPVTSTSKMRTGSSITSAENDDIIICGGINIAAPELEAVLLEHDGVYEAAVVASPDEM
jgi:hypothetical protein